MRDQCDSDKRAAPHQDKPLTFHQAEVDSSRHYAMISGLADARESISSLPHSFGHCRVNGLADLPHFQRWY
jgi:hypothetical protein